MQNKDDGFWIVTQVRFKEGGLKKWYKNVSLIPFVSTVVNCVYITQFLISKMGNLRLPNDKNMLTYSLSTSLKHYKKGEKMINMLYILQKDNLRLPEVCRSLYLNYLIFRYVCITTIYYIIVINKYKHFILEVV